MFNINELCSISLRKISASALHSALLCFVGASSLTCQALEKQYGISFAGYSYNEYATPSADRSLENLAATGVEWTNILASQMMENIDSTSIYRSSGDGMTPSDASLVHAIKKAHSLGLKVMLYPHLELANDPTHWFGELGMKFNKERWQEWFVAYTKFLSHYADIAQANGVEQMSIGMELLYAEKQEAHWRKLINNLRQRYKGTLVYAENYENKTGSSVSSNVSWWDEMDYIGIDAYYNLIPESNKNPTFEDMMEAWKPIVKRLEEYSRKWNKPILIPELGYRSRKNAIHHPWEYKNNKGDVDLEKQAIAYEAFYQNFADKPWFGGVFWWAFTTNPKQGGPNDINYTPFNKPAEVVIRRYITEPSPEPENKLNNRKEINNSGIVLDGDSTDWPDNLAINDENSGTSPVDFLKAWSKQDNDYVYVAYNNRTTIDINNFWAWLILIDTDKNMNTGANIYGEMGADYIVLGAQLYKYTGDGSNWKWTYTRDVKHAINGQFAELAISKADLNRLNEVDILLWGSNFFVDGSQDDNVNLSQ